jgi:hypothetical protein
VNRAPRMCDQRVSGDLTVTLRTTIAALLTVLALSTPAAADVCPSEVMQQREAMRDRLAYVSRRGLEGDHHYSVVFKTAAKGVVMPSTLLAQYPDEMSVILQHQFEALKVFVDRFDVTLWFKGKKTRITIPFGAVTLFVDPSVNFRIEPDPSFRGVTCDFAS